MLEHINDALCVSRFFRHENNLWACYKPSPDCSEQKRKTWKPVTALLTTIEMKNYLRKHYQEESISKKFIDISTK